MSTSPATALTHDDALWQTELFAAAPTRRLDPTTVSATAAYQDALHGRAVLLDLRSDDERARDGRIDPRLSVREVRPGADLTDLAGARRLHLVGSPAPAGVVEPATLAAFDPDDPGVRTVRGGFDAWRAAGLPVER